MGGIFFWQLIIIAAIVLITLWPCWRILAKAGFSRWWVILVFLPIVNLVMVWLFAFIRWPNYDQNA